MHLINVRNVHEALPEAIYQLYRVGVQRESRNGPVLVAPEPVTTLYQSPMERVLFWPERDANPFFHLMESLWMLGGRRDVAFPRQFAANIASYSDDGAVFHAAYGHRWRNWFEFDQLPLIAERLRKNHEDRRQVLVMWDPSADLNVDQSNGKDYPCNYAATFQVNPWGGLDMVVDCRSNDIVWGCYGANAVHFSYLLEYMAARAGVPVGRYWQVSKNWHGYLKTVEPLRDLQAHAKSPFTSRLLAHSPYERGEVRPYPLLAQGEDPSAFDNELQMFLDSGGNALGYQSNFLRRVAIPVLRAWEEYKGHDGEAKYILSMAALDQCRASDWARACQEWVRRRYLKFKAEQEMALVANSEEAKAT